MGDALRCGTLARRKNNVFLDLPNPRRPPLFRAEPALPRASVSRCHMILAGTWDLSSGSRVPLDHACSAKVEDFRRSARGGVCVW